MNKPQPYTSLLFSPTCTQHTMALGSSLGTASAITQWTFSIIFFLLISASDSSASGFSNQIVSQLHLQSSVCVCVCVLILERKGG
jgi:hypothetical protein